MIIAPVFASRQRLRSRWWCRRKTERVVSTHGEHPAAVAFRCTAIWVVVQAMLYPKHADFLIRRSRVNNTARRCTIHGVLNPEPPPFVTVRYTQGDLASLGFAPSFW